MRILMRNTVLKGSVLAGLFSCMMVLAGAFSGITASVHATHNQNFIHAEDVGTDKEKLKQFVEAAIDAYYIDFIFREHCEFPDSLSATVAPLLEAPVKSIRDLIPLGAQFGLSLGEICDYEGQPFSKLFRSEDAEDGEWKSDPIYLFVMDHDKRLLFSGADGDIEGEVLEAVDRGDRNVADEIIKGARNAGGDFVDYCWDDPTVEGDDEDNPNSMTAPGFSWKTSYVVDPADYLKVPPDPSFPKVIFGSGIYPKTGAPPSGCRIVTDDEMEEMEEMEEPMEEMEEPMEEMEEPMEEAEDIEDMVEDVVDSVSGGGCAIAAGSDSTPRNDALNLLLIVSALFLSVSFGNRAVGRRNGNGS